MKKKVDARDKILKSAKRIAYEEGFNKVNIRSVAKESDISIGTVYNYYESKAEILEDVIDDFLEGAFSEINKKDFTGKSLIESIDLIYSDLYDYLNSFQEYTLTHYALLRTKEKHINGCQEEEYTDEISDNLINLMDNDEKLKDYEWSETFNKKVFATFICDNLFILLNKGQRDISIFLDILEKLLYNQR